MKLPIAAFLGISAISRLYAADAPVVAAHPKGPNQINLTWAAPGDPGYGYLVEIQSAEDARYKAWTVLQPIRDASGYTCDSTVVFRGGRCIISDPAGAQVYNPPIPGVPYWVTDVNYTDPQDGSAAQFIAWSLKPGTTYTFRVRTYSGQEQPAYGPYSEVVTAKTASYAARYVSLAGADTNDGKTAARAWRTLAHATASLDCGEVLLVAAGTYANDQVQMKQQCTDAAKAVVLVDPGETATLTSQPPNTPRPMSIDGSHIVIDGLEVATPGTQVGEYDIEVRGSYNAFLNVNIHAPMVPSFKWGLAIYGSNNLVYRSWLHDYGSPDATQNGDGNGGFVLVLIEGAHENVVWSNHLTRGGHDTSSCLRGCNVNRWLNNVMDGGWGQGVSIGPGPGGNLIEGNIMQGSGQLVSFYKPSIQLSGPANSVRRNVVLNSKTWGLEIGSYGGEFAVDNLVYNNVFYNPGGCYMQASNRGYRAYYFDLLANNICYRIHDLATRIYLNNTSNRIVNNSILYVDPAGKPQPERLLIVWNQNGGNDYEPARTVSGADRAYSPPFFRNAEFSLLPGFVDESKLDLHLAANSPFRDAGLPISDPRWGWTNGSVDLGPFGIRIAKEWKPPVWRSDEAVLKAIRATKPPHAEALQAAVLRALDEDEAAAVALAKTAASGIPERYERTIQGERDPTLWDLLASKPGQLLEAADLYLEWGLTRDALNLLAHPYPAASLALNDAMVLYYRAYCHDLLDYNYYTAIDLHAATALPINNVVPTGRHAVAVLRLALARDPLDTTAWYLLGVHEQSREALQTVLRLRPGHPEATALLAKLGGPAPAAPRPTPATSAAIAPAPAATSLSSPRAIAAQALILAASGDVEGGMRLFNATNFPANKYEDAIREAYIELRLQRLLAMTSTRPCPAADAGITHFGDEDKSLPFTFTGFGEFIKAARFQYVLGLVENACVDEKAARKRWEKVAKTSPAMTSPDYGYQLLALKRIDPDEASGKAKLALTFLRRQLTTAAPETKGVMLYNQGILLAIQGKRDEAIASFRAGADASPAGMVEYLNRDAVRLIDTLLK